MVTHKDRLVVLSFMTQPYQNLSTEHPNQSISDLIDTRFLDPQEFDENRVIERYREEYEEDDLDDDLYDLGNNGLDNESAITFATGSTNNFTDLWSTDPTRGYQAPIRIENTLETTVDSTTYNPPVTSTSTSTKRGRHGKKNSRYKNRKNNNNNKSSEEDRRYEIKSDEIDFDKMIDQDLPPIFEGVKPANEQTRPKKPNHRRVTTEAPFEPPKPSRVPQKRVKDSNIHILKPERVPENALPSTPVSTNSKIYEIKPSPAGKNLSRKSRQHSDSDLEFEIQSVDEDDFIIRDEETGEVIRPARLQAVPENISLQYKELHGVEGFIQRLLGNQEVFGKKGLFAGFYLYSMSTLFRSNQMASHPEFGVPESRIGIDGVVRSLSISLLEYI